MVTAISVVVSVNSRYQDNLSYDYDILPRHHLLAIYNAIKIEGDTQRAP
ncbi:Uncharacterised protein [Yersinia intermedia]|uniref:Uncharacterized protein n=1 Tax=Yersinia aldovae TaxID=29483 RepID=A0ABM9SU51_YERAL|nr:Uncharacterised protein [Yersinia intermedia]CNL16551.1 Uncharacterised protein [Yersinia aldovae]